MNGVPEQCYVYNNIPEQRYGYEQCSRTCSRRSAAKECWGSLAPHSAGAATFVPHCTDATMVICHFTSLASSTWSCVPPLVSRRRFLAAPISWTNHPSDGLKYGATACGPVPLDAVYETLMEINTYKLTDDVTDGKISGKIQCVPITLAVTKIRQGWG